MIEYSRYNPNTGEILATGVMQPECAHMYEPYIPQKADLFTQYVNTITLQIVDKPPKPGDYYDFDYATKQWVLNTDKALTANKAKRNTYLQESDWTQLPDVALTPTEVDAWKSYRQQLRDMTDAMLIYGDFPTKP
jgi:hypothetical protein